jgi:thiamine biosynthesis lipoprotein
MGSVYTVALYGEDRAQLEATIEQAFDEVRRLDRMLSNYRADSDWSEVNRYAAQRPVKVTPEFFKLLSSAVGYSRASQGTFDITVGPLMRVWGFYKGSGRLPRKDEVSQALASVGYGNMQLDPETRTVRFAKPGVEMDPGGIGKGYAVDKVVEVLRESGVHTAMVSAGTSSVYAMGVPPGEKGWKVGIRHPRSSRQTVAEVFLKDESLSTSGNYEKFFLAEGKMYSHIMDPRTGYPAQGVLSVSVIAPNTLDSEAWTKPFFVLGRQWAARHRPAGFRIFLCEDRSELTCEWLQ